MDRRMEGISTGGTLLLVLFSQAEGEEAECSGQMAEFFAKCREMVRGCFSSSEQALVCMELAFLNTVIFAIGKNIAM